RVGDKVIIKKPYQSRFNGDTGVVISRRPNKRVEVHLENNFILTIRESHLIKQSCLQNTELVNQERAKSKDTFFVGDEACISDMDSPYYGRNVVIVSKIDKDKY